MYRYALLSSLPTRLSSSFSFSNAKLSVMFLKKWKNISSIFVKESKLPVNFLQHCLHHCAVVLNIAGHLFLRHFSLVSLFCRTLLAPYNLSVYPSPNNIKCVFSMWKKVGLVGPWLCDRLCVPVAPTHLPDQYRGRPFINQEAKA